jgi:hypothetical protein
MFSFKKNLTTKGATDADTVGLDNFFDFICAVFSRIAYTEDPMPLFLISGVYGINSNL